MTPIIDVLTSTAIALVAYHHAGYPLLLRAVSQNSGTDKTEEKPDQPRGFVARETDASLPTVTVLIPAYNEAQVIGAKIMNILSLDYPVECLRLTVVCDGCDDGTYEAALAATAFDEDALARVTLVNGMVNRGKVAILNEQIPRCDSDLVVLTDASSIVAVDALLRAVRHFEDPRVSSVSGTYRLLEPGSTGEAAYWAYQTRLRTAEASLGGAIGAHGAFYLLRRNAFQPMPVDTINDDFVLPMTLVANGGRAVYDPSVLAYELEGTSLGADWRRRLRIGAGNLQQAVRLLRLLSPRHGGTALAFFSGKFLRAFMPFLMLISFLGSLTLASDSVFWAAIFGAQGLGTILAGLVHLAPSLPWPRPARSVHYLIQGHLANGLGAVFFLLGRYHRPWRRAAA